MSRQSPGTVILRFYAELNDSLPEGVDRVVECELAHDEEVGRLIEGCGVPLEAVELILVDGISVGPRHRVGAGQRVAVYPMFEAFDVGSELRLRPRPLRSPRFTVTPELAGLAALLGDRGHDVEVGTEARDGRILLTFDPGRAESTHRLVLEGDDLGDLLRQIVERLQLDSSQVKE